MDTNCDKYEKRRKVIWDVEKVKSVSPSYSGFANISWLMLAFIVLFPALMLIVDRLEKYNWSIFCLIIFVFGLVVSASRLNFNKFKNPIFAYYFWLIFFSPRVFFPGAMLWYANTSYPIIFELFILALWGFVEYLAYKKCWALSDKSIIKTFKPNFRVNADGDVLYDSTKRRSEKWADPHQSESGVLYYFENFGGYLLAIFGPAIFIFSQLQRYNFEPRYIIMMIICLVLGVGSRFVLTDYYFVKRAIKLKQVEKF